MSESTTTSQKPVVAPRGRVFLNKHLIGAGGQPVPPPLPSLEAQAKALMRASLPTLTAADETVTQDDELLDAKANFFLEYEELKENFKTSQYRAVIDALPGVVDSAEKILKAAATTGSHAERKVPRGTAQTTRPQPSQQPGQQTPQQPRQDAPQLDPAMVARAQAAMNQVRTLLQTAASVATTTPAVTAAKSDFQNQYAKLLSHEQTGNASAMLVTLPRVVGLARKVLALADAAQVPAKQIAEQKAQYDGVKGVCDDVVRTYFSPTAAASVNGIAAENLEPDKYFSNYMAALHNVEQRKMKLPRTGPIPPSSLRRPSGSART